MAIGILSRESSPQIGNPFGNMFNRLANVAGKCLKRVQSFVAENTSFNTEVSPLTSDIEAHRRAYLSGDYIGAFQIEKNLYAAQLNNTSGNSWRQEWALGQIHNFKAKEQRNPNINHPPIYVSPY